LLDTWPLYGLLSVCTVEVSTVETTLDDMNVCTVEVSTVETTLDDMNVRLLVTMYIFIGTCQQFWSYEL